LDYSAAGGKEILLSFEDDNETLFGLLRLRIQSKPVPSLGRGEKGNEAIIRELHIFGPEVPLNEKSDTAASIRVTERLCYGKQNASLKKSLKRGGWLF
jgi:elongator complex protein 3